MPSRITDPQPTDVAEQLTRFSAALDRVIPASRPDRTC
jgi:hypothetical protein